MAGSEIENEVKLILDQEVISKIKTENQLGNIWGLCDLVLKT